MPAPPGPRRGRAALGRAVLLAVLAACARRGQPGPSGPEPAGVWVACEAVEAAADSLILRRPGARLALAAATDPAQRGEVAAAYRDAVRQVPGLDSTTWASFVARNRAPAPVCGAFPSGAEVVLVPDSVPRALRAEAGNPDGYWRAFYARYPRAAGLTSTSGVGVSADGRQALLTLAHGCGGRCGHGHVVLLERARGGRWRVRHARMTWIS